MLYNPGILKSPSVRQASGISGSRSAAHLLDCMLTHLLLLPLDLSSVCLRGSEHELGEKGMLQVWQSYVYLLPFLFMCWIGSDE